MGDHPRLRGEHRDRRAAPAAAPGPPPPARGARGCRPRTTPCHGTTPACAGSTLPPKRRVARWWDHPRLRGEHLWTMTESKARKGPPPPARGARSDLREDVRQRGTTPACAGSTTSRSPAACSPTDHPRLRGEHARGAQAKVRREGPPPPARGALPAAEQVAGNGGTTPACAGSTLRGA